MNRDVPCRALVVVVIIFAAVICFSHIHQGTLAVDAIRYATIAHEIANSGNWFSLVDPYYGTTYVAKPPLLFWITALGFKCFGFSTFIAKLPAVVFTFLALLSIWIIARKETESAGLWALILVALNRSFSRDLVDFGFDGMALLGATLAFAVALRLISEKERLSWKVGVLAALSLLCLLQSKPPYLVLVASPIVTILLLQRRLNVLLHAPLIVGIALIGALPTLIWINYLDPAVLPLAGERQISTFFVLHNAVLENVVAWMRSFLVNFVPLSLVSLLAIGSAMQRLWRNGWRNEPTVLLSVLWFMQLLPIFFLIAPRPRYLWVPLVPGIFLSASLLARHLPQITPTKLRRAMLTIAALVLVTVYIFRTGLHRSNPYITALRSHGQSIQKMSLALCSSETDLEVRQRILQHAQLLTKLEYGQPARIGTAEDLQEFFGAIVGDRGCRSTLAGRAYTTQDMPNGFSIMTRHDAAMPSMISDR